MTMDGVAFTEGTGDSSETDGLWPLPKGWVWVRLGKIVDLHDHRRKPIKSEDRQTRIAGKSTTELYPYFGATGQVGLIDGYLFDFPAILLGEDGAPFLDRRRSKAYSVAGRYFPAPSIVLRVRCFAQLGCNTPRECERISSSLFEN